MKKLLLSIAYCFIAVSVFGQQATWNGATSGWNYSFAGGTGGNLSGNNINNTSTAPSPGFLPGPASGAMILRSGSSASATVFTVDGVTNALQFKSPETTNLARLALMGVENTTAIASVNFTINFSHADSEWALALGKSTATATNTYNNTTSLTASNATGINIRKASFAGFRWQSGKLQLITHDADGGTATFTDLINYSAGTHKLEFLCNNSALNQYYTKNGIQYTIPTRHFHFWMNDNRVEVNAGNYNFPANGLAVGDVINSLMIQGKNESDQTTEDPANDILTISNLNIQSVSATTLPVSLTSFTGKSANNGVLLNWQTASESNNSHFDILRFSEENHNPIKIGEVAGKGNSTSLVNYHFTDQQPLTGGNYYLLRQVDHDGKYTLSEIVPVKVGLNDTRFYVYQANSENYNASFYSEKASLGTFTLLDLNGRILNHQQLPLQKGNNTISLNKQSLSPGVYLSRIMTNGEEIIRKFIVN
jgi:hypothetical protein